METIIHGQWLISNKDNSHTYTKLIHKTEHREDWNSLDVDVYASPDNGIKRRGILRKTVQP